VTLPPLAEMMSAAIAFLLTSSAQAEAVLAPLTSRAFHFLSKGKQEVLAGNLLDIYLLEAALFQHCV
jgi:hypothetical protein